MLVSAQTHVYANRLPTESQTVGRLTQRWRTVLLGISTKARCIISRVVFLAIRYQQVTGFLRTFWECEKIKRYLNVSPN